PCSSFRCKRGKTCKLSADLTPACVCQEPSDCPVGLSNFDHVCGTDNKTYGTACELFATKCNLEGTKRGHKLHLDYTGPCKRTYTGSYTDPCSSFRCKRGKTCKLSADLTPACVCQEPSDCPVGLSNFDHVCGTDNKTYGTACELFATKCNLEGTKRGHKLHLDYTGPCKRTYTGSYTGALQ
ncbi:hypothetical protein CRUP_036422, partial [Coryphaenoides rupestris]